MLLSRKRMSSASKRNTAAEMARNTVMARFTSRVSRVWSSALMMYRSVPSMRVVYTS